MYRDHHSQQIRQKYGFQSILKFSHLRYSETSEEEAGLISLRPDSSRTAQPQARRSHGKNQNREEADGVSHASTRTHAPPHRS